MSFRSGVTQPSGSIPPIHILDDDSLLIIFSLYRPVILVGADIGVRAGNSGPPRWGEWTRERWWHELSHVCQRWRKLILASASYLGLCLVCTYGTSVARMLECFPPLPIVLDYPHVDRRRTAQDKDGILLALQHRARLYRIRLCVPPSHEEKLVMAIEMEFPMLEYLYIGISNLVIVHQDLEISQTFQAPRLRHLALTRCPFLVASPSLMTSTGLVTLSLMSLPHQCCYHPYDLIQRLSVLTQLEVLRISTFDDRLTHELEGQQSDIPLITHLTLPNLRLFEFAGHNNYLKTLLPWMTTPLLEKLQIIFIPYMTTPAPTLNFLFLLQFINKADVLGFGSAKLLFDGLGATARVYPREGARVYDFYLRTITSPLHLQVPEMAKIFGNLGPAFSSVVDLTIDYSGHNLLYEWAELVHWRDLLKCVNNVKILRVHGISAKDLSYCLLTGGEPLPGVLPQLQVVECPVGCDARDAFAAFVNLRKAEGYPIRLILVDPPPASTSP